MGQNKAPTTSFNKELKRDRRHYHSVFISFSRLVNCAQTHTDTLVGAGGTLQSGVSGPSSSVRLRSVSLIRGSLVQDISIGHPRGLGWLCSAASSSTESVTLLFYSSEGRAHSLCCLFPISVCGLRNKLFSSKL